MSFIKKNILLFILGILLLSTMACVDFQSLLPSVNLGNNDPPSPSEGDRAGNAVSIKHQDDFSNEKSGWEIGTYSGGELAYSNGKYTIISYADGSTMWGGSGLRYDDMIIDIDTDQITAPDNNNNDYGVVCRLQADGSGYYGLISGDGFYAILKGSEEGGVFDPLVNWTEADVIRTGNKNNHIRLSCLDNQLTLYVNDELLAETKDSTYLSGEVGLTATSYESSPTEIHFDNLEIR